MALEPPGEGRRDRCYAPIDYRRSREAQGRPRAAGHEGFTSRTSTRAVGRIASRAEEPEKFEDHEE